MYWCMPIFATFLQRVGRITIICVGVKYESTGQRAVVLTKYTAAGVRDCQTPNVAVRTGGQGKVTDCYKEVPVRFIIISSYIYLDLSYKAVCTGL